LCLLALGMMVLVRIVLVIWILTVFLIAGRLILEFFGISLGVLRIAGGLLVAHTAWEMVAVRQRLTESEGQAAIDKEDISFTPMAVPLVSGPGAIGVAIGQGASPRDIVHYLGCFFRNYFLGSDPLSFSVFGRTVTQSTEKKYYWCFESSAGIFYFSDRSSINCRWCVCFIKRGCT
jgi:multiple antibiotic resistance protein